VEAGYVALAIPVFFVLIGVELWVGKSRGQQLYRLNDALNDLSCGILQRLAMLLFAAFLFAGYLAIHDRFALATLSSDSAVVWIACFIGVDFLYYWYHRLSRRRFRGISAINTLYQFWIHTRTIDRLGSLESVFMTPSHHRVHHGRNPIYLDRNHGGTFILWDKLFGTFQLEEEEVAYGVTKPRRYGTRGLKIA